MGHNSVPMLPISNPIGPVGPVANCLNPYPEKSGSGSGKSENPDFLKVVELVTGFRYVPRRQNDFCWQNFRPAQPEENWRADFETEEVYIEEFSQKSNRAIFYF